MSAVWSVLVIATVVITGLAIVRALPLRLRRREMWALSVVAGWLVVGVVTLVASLAAGPSLGVPLISALLLVGSSVWLFVSRRTPPQFVPRESVTPRMRWGHRAIAVVVSAVVVVSFWLAFRLPSQGPWYTFFDTWGDFPLHAAMIKHLANQNDQLTLSAPYYVDSRLNYPFMINWVSSLLLRTGASWQFSVVAPTLSLFGSALVLMYSVAYRVSRRWYAAWFPVVLLLMSGSFFSGWRVLARLVSNGVSGVEVGFTTLYAYYGDMYANALLTHFLPQRPFTFGLAIAKGLALGVLATSSGTSRWWIVAIGVITGAVPLIHTHTYVVLLGVLALAVIWPHQRHRRIWVVSAVAALAIGLPQLLWQGASSRSGDFIAWIGGWAMRNWELLPVSSVWWFWPSTIGAMIVLWLGAWWSARTPAPLFIRVIGVATTGLFLVANMVRFQPNPFDNMKFFLYCLIMGGLVLAYVVGQMTSRRARAAVAVLVALHCVMGAASIIHMWYYGRVMLYSQDEIAVGRWLDEILPKDALVLTTTAHNHPVFSLAGRRLVVAYGGWQNLYDTRYEQINADVKAVLTDPSADRRQFVRTYGVDYVVLRSGHVEQGLPVAIETWQQDMPVYATKDSWVVLKATP